MLGQGSSSLLGAFPQNILGTMMLFAELELAQEGIKSTLNEKIEDKNFLENCMQSALLQENQSSFISNDLDETYKKQQFWV